MISPYLLRLPPIAKEIRVLAAIERHIRVVGGSSASFVGGRCVCGSRDEGLPPPIWMHPLALQPSAVQGAESYLLHHWPSASNTYDIDRHTAKSSFFIILSFFSRST